MNDKQKINLQRALTKFWARVERGEVDDPRERERQIRRAYGEGNSRIVHENTVISRDNTES